jgi:pimeloyl-ACP methyl ester carboxylesterase
VPTLLIVGADDHFHLHRIAETLEEKIAGATRILIPDTHHMPNIEKPEEFNQVVLDFLEAL